MQGRNGMGFCFPKGYKYCGPGCSGPGQPINAVDAACREHDRCYKQHGGPSCACDKLFMKRLASEIDPYTKEGRDAHVLYQYMKLQSFLGCGFQKRRG
ncbi:phospholipase [Oceanobacillus kapialis]|uniref:Phospholipase n=1 Tax=Oceanobacillus kapialis TaxID=481353 RepID=A0ABW5PVS8_9BACI